ncbi:MAG: hypothetical protein JSR90_17670 [Proteobacteria bacterium]|nr:hypothetical protein [Pseudomonadota bacterium]
MQDFIRSQNIKLLQAAIERESNADKRVVLERLLADQVRQEVPARDETTSDAC